MKPKVLARAAELNAEPELFQFKANITYLIKSKAQKYHILCNQTKNLYTPLHPSEKWGLQGINFLYFCSKT